jgi:S1-C subfamily serine protease
VEDSSDVYRDIHKVVEPSVVEIQVTKTVPHAQTQIPEEFQRFFHDFGGGQFNIRRRRRQRIKRRCKKKSAPAAASSWMFPMGTAIS